jgi:hypothetical protein
MRQGTKGTLLLDISIFFKNLFLKAGANMIVSGTAVVNAEDPSKVSLKRNLKISVE